MHFTNGYMLNLFSILGVQGSHAHLSHIWLTSGEKALHHRKITNCNKGHLLCTSPIAGPSLTISLKCLYRHSLPSVRKYCSEAWSLPFILWPHIMDIALFQMIFLQVLHCAQTQIVCQRCLLLPNLFFKHRPLSLAGHYRLYVMSIGHFWQTPLNRRTSSCN